MPKLPVLSFREVDRALRQMGFAPIRQKGSHVVYRHQDGRTTTVPNHGGRDLAPPLLRAILGDIRISAEEFLRVLRS